jgi:hypothetical protein
MPSRKNELRSSKKEVELPLSPEQNKKSLYDLKEMVYVFI